MLRSAASSDTVGGSATEDPPAADSESEAEAASLPRRRPTIAKSGKKKATKIREAEKATAKDHREQRRKHRRSRSSS